MKQIFLVVFQLIVSFTFTQTTTSFYDWKWQPCDISKARFYSTLDKSDSGWLRNDYFMSTQKLQMKALYKDSACKIMNGNAIYFYANGSIEASGRKIDNKTQGIYLRWHPNGMMADSGLYDNDRIMGTKLSWHANGIMSDSTTAINDSVSVSVSWFDNGNPSSYGLISHEKKHGKWNYFHSNGKPSAIEMNEYGKAVSIEYFNEDGSPQPDSSQVRREAVFKSGIEAWKKYVLNKTYWPEEYKITNSDVAVVVVRFIINEDGQVEDPFVSTPFHPLMDKIALDVIRKSPVWKPEMDHNRRVKAYRQQPITFIQE